MLKVWVAPIRTWPVRLPAPGWSMAMPWSTSFSAREAKAEEQLARLGRHDAPADAIEQRLADLVLELADLVRQGRLGDVDCARRRA